MVFCRKHKGNSLIECVVSIALMSIIISGIVVLTIFINNSRLSWKEYDRLGNLSVSIINEIEEDLRNNVNIEEKDYNIHNIYENMDDFDSSATHDAEEYTTGAEITIVKCRAYDEPIYRVKMKLSGQANTHLLITTFIGGETNA